MGITSKSLHTKSGISIMDTGGATNKVGGSPCFFKSMMYSTSTIGSATLAGRSSRARST